MVTTVQVVLDLMQLLSGINIMQGKALTLCSNPEKHFSHVLLRDLEDKQWLELYKLQLVQQRAE